MSALKRLLKMLMHLLCTPLFRNHFALTSHLSVPVSGGINKSRALLGFFNLQKTNTD